MHISAKAPYLLLLGDFVWLCLAYGFLRKSPLYWRIILVLWMIVQMAALWIALSGRVADSTRLRWEPTPVLAFVYIWHYLELPMLVALGGGIVWVRRLQTRRRKSEPAPAAGGEGMTRRQFVAVAVTAAPVAAALGLTEVGLAQMGVFRVRRLTATLNQLPAALDGMTIAQVSDLHIGRFTNGKILEDVVKATNDLHADLVTLTGDLINLSLGDLPVAIDLVRALKAPGGVYLCEGNHDLLQGRDNFHKGLEKAGLPLLVNESTETTIRGQRVQLLGLRWGLGGSNVQSLAERSDRAISAAMKDLLPSVRPDAFPILLAHHPHAFDFAGDIPLTLAGHTHGGQVMLTNEFGIGSILFRYWSGLYERNGRALVVANGVGNWFPLRVNAPAEIVHLTLRRA
jgi:hypothetical protein